MEDLKSKTITELQSLAYQNMRTIEAYRKGLEAIEAEMALRDKKE